MCELITAGFNGADCLDAVAGFKAAYFVNFDSDYDFTIVEDDTAGIAISGIPATDFDVYKFDLKNTGNTFNEVSSGDRNTGTTVFTATLNLVFTKVTPVKAFQIRSMVWGRPIVFLETNGGDIIASGLTRGVEFVSTTDIAGEIDGNNQFQLAGTAQEPNPSYFLDDTAATSLRDAVVT